MPTANGEPGSISKALLKLSADDHSAVQQIWDRFFDRLCSYASSRIYKRMNHLVEAEDVASKAFFALWDGIQNDRFATLRDRDDLWRLLTVLAARLTSNMHRHHDAQKRGLGNVASVESVSVDGMDGVMSYLNREVDPAREAEFENTVESLVTRLKDPVARDIIFLRLAGHSYEEIAEQLRISNATVGRKMRRVRGLWTTLME